MKKLQLMLSLLLVLGCWSGAAIAQTTPAPQAESNEETELDDAIEQFGYVSGVAFQCVPTREAASVEQEALRVFTGITRLFGSDRAFFYAAAYGTGATTSIRRSQCVQYVRRFRETLRNNALTGGDR